MRSRSSVDSQNLDSLLDTMANVVGILVVILAVTQISVGEAMKRIRAYEDEAAVEQALERERSSELRIEMDVLETELASLNVEAKQQEQSGLTEAAALLRRSPDAVELAEADTQQVTAALERESRQAASLEAKIEERSRRLASLRISLDSMPDIGPGKSVRLPDPRPAPPGTVSAAFFCRYGRIFRVDLDTLKAQLVEVLKQSPGEAFPEIGSAELRWKPLPAARGRFAARLQWRSHSVGETLVEAQAQGSAYRGALAELHPKRNTLLFYVWPDSYDVYLRAREIGYRSGYLAGWEALPADRESDWVQSTDRFTESAVPID